MYVGLWKLGYNNQNMNISPYLQNNNHIGEQLWGEGVEGSCALCPTLELAHYHYAKNDQDLLLIYP